ncbi:cytochrome P450 3A8-like [Centruroides vittatus]|uniref:cytochrome P450 3A8-like n=1 Tax=Centruroides vittatus TaxID=120091 RepID=UPI00350FD4E4
MDVGFGFTLPNWLILLSMVVILFYIYVDKKFRYWKEQGVESETKLEFVTGMITALRKPFHEIILAAYKKHGKLFGTCMPTHDIWISKPELIKYILVKDFPTFHNRVKFDFGDEIFNRMVSVLIDEDWKRVRNLMSPTFTSSRMRKMANLVKKCAESLAARFNEIAEKGKKFNCKELISAFTIDVTASTAFATKVNAQENQNSEFVENARMIANRNISKLTFFMFFVAPKLVSYLKLEFFPRKVLQYFRNIVLKILEERKQKKVKGNDFLQLMMDAQEGVLENTAEDLKEVENEINNYKVQPKHKTMSLEDIVAQSILFIIGGHDPTTATLTFFCYEMALNPECQEKLLKEIDETWQTHDNVDFDIVSKMTYLDAVLNEILRIHNPGVSLQRTASEDYKLPETGITIKKGSNVIIPTHGMHHDPEYFPEPERFKPERFLPENRESIKPYTFLPFGDGPRNCIGMRFVTMVMKICIVYMLRDVRLVATEETRKPLEYYYGQNAQVKEVILKAEKRTRFH